MISVCHPLPWDLKKSIISLLSRIVSCFFGLLFGGRPLLGSTDRSSSGKTSEVGLICSKSFGVNSLTSPFLFVNGCLFIAFYLSGVGFTETDHSDSACYRRKADDVQPPLQVSYCDESLFRVIVAYIFNDLRRFSVKLRCLLKREVAFLDVPVVFALIVFNLHTVYCNYINVLCQLFCSYENELHELSKSINAENLYLE